MSDKNDNKIKSWFGKMTGKEQGQKELPLPPEEADEMLRQQTLMAGEMTEEISELDFSSEDVFEESGESESADAEVADVSGEENARQRQKLEESNGGANSEGIDQKEDKDSFVEKMTANKKRIFVSLGIAILLVLLTTVMFSDRFYNMVTGKAGYVLNETGTVVEGADGSATVTLMGGNVLRCSQDGVMALNEIGEVAWDVPFTMSSPYILTAGEYVSVADRLGTKLLTIKGGTIVSEITTQSTILLNCVNALGQSAVVLEADKGHTVTLYAPNGSQLMERRTYSASDGIPMVVALSDDGTRMATVYVNYSGSSLKSVISIFDLTETGSALADRIVGSQTFENCLISDIRFTSEGCFYAGSDRVGMLTIGKSCETVWESMLEYRIDAMSMTDDYFVVLYGDGQAGVAKPVENNIVVYSYNGKELCSKAVEGADYLDAWNGTVIYGVERSYSAMSSTGKPEWNYDSTENYSKMIEFKNGTSVAALRGGAIVFFDVSLKGVSQNNGLE